MSKTITQNSLNTSNDIINSISASMDSKFTLVLLSILEGVLNLVKEEYLEKYFDSNKKYITVKELGKIFYERGIYKNTGLAGICFERFVYDSLVVRREDITTFIKESLYRLDALSITALGEYSYISEAKNIISDDIDIILWADEKGSWIKDPTLNLTLNCIADNDVILIKNKLENFKQVLKVASFNNSLFNNVGKADLFVRQKGSSLWHGINVKKNVDDLEMTSPDYKNLEIGVALTTKKLSFMQKELLNYSSMFYNLNKNTNKNKYIFIFPTDINFGEILTHYLDMLITFLYKIVAIEENTTNTNSLLAPLPIIFHYLYFHKDESIFKIIESLDNSLKQDGIFLPTRIYLPGNVGTFLMNGYVVNSLSFENNNLFESESMIV